MNWVQFWVEAAATVAESWVVISTVTEMSGSSLFGRKKHILIVGCVLILTAIISTLNLIQSFSYITIFISILTAILLTRITSKETMLFRTFATLLVYLIILSIDYVVLFSFGMGMGTPITSATTFSHLIDFGPLRCWFLLTDKGIDLFLFIILKYQFQKLKIIRRRFLVSLTMFLLFAHSITSTILSLVWSYSIVALQMVVICSWIFILICVCISLCFSISISKYESEKEKNELLNTCNMMMEKNYQRIHKYQQATAKMIHDCNHHLGTLRELARRHNNKEMNEYLNALLATNYKEQAMCKSGNDVVNAIINYKIGEAGEHNINFRYSINADVPTSLLAVDLCAILANQIDNAFDACRRIDDSLQRTVNVHIWQKSDHIFLFQVSNSVAENPLKQNPQLNSTKADSSVLHGLGLRSISETAEKYGGVLENSYQDGQFYSTVFLNLNT